MKVIRQAAIKYVFLLMCLVSARLSAAEARANNEDGAQRITAPPSSQLFEERQSEPWLFQSLKCNQNITRTGCDTWSAVFGNASSYSEQVLIPCGECIIMDNSAPPSLALEGGLDIQGRLIFPDGLKLTLQAPYILVQGVLDMYSTKTPNGEPDVKFVLTGTDEDVTQFVPADSNSEACAEGFCEVGKKPIVVAGGKLVIEALPLDFPPWVLLFDVVGDNAIVVSDSVKNQWGIGSEIMITSHTLKYDEEQVRTITDVYDHLESGYVVIVLDSAILRPITEKDNPDFGVEVALLSRNFVFEGVKDDPNEFRGAHLIVFHTGFSPRLLLPPCCSCACAALTTTNNSILVSINNT